MKILIFSLILLVLISGCTQQIQPTPIQIDQQAKNVCIDLCNSYKETENLDNGPCLSDNNKRWVIVDWVCDVAHSPRQTVDDLPENQCSAYREDKAHHFVEVDINCNFIQAI